ncbi:ATP-binding cassette subfamily B protein [Stackebrandtia endophytica]|uniref:ATP-binding cassette subfamily B protein n=1 Tax=Stackebrandtia endophytica TaxID=1496996 RepID=A0A543AUL2_9ACTN|nr:ABC transporter ATP-binding protein [Stackebrandtia endophytica]TQL76262.1 ATP-binding cassette subfamily B protein [Stackebrandtia endophytica]
MTAQTPEKASITRDRLRLLWSFARPFRGALLVGLLLALAGSAMGLATPMVTKWVLDALGAGESLSGPIIALTILLVFGAAVFIVQWTLVGSVGEKVVLRARESMVRRYLRAKILQITAKPTGELVARVTSDTVLLREAAASSFIGLINGAVMLVGTLVMMAILDLVLLATTVAAVVVVGIAFMFLMPPIAKAQEQAQEHVGRLSGTLESTLRAIRTIKVSRAENRQADRIIDSAGESAKYGIKAVRREAFAWTLSWTGIQAAIIMILGIGAWRTGLGLLEVSSLIAFLLYAFGLMEPIMELSQNMTALQSGMAAAARIRAVEAIDVETDTVDEAPQPQPSLPVLRLLDVTAAYGPGLEPAVRHLNLTIPRTGHTAIVGPSGAGKTTVFSLLLRFLEPQGGHLELDGNAYDRYRYEQIREKLAYVEQETPVVPGTIRENLLLTHPDASEEELRQALEDVRLTELIDSLPDGLETELSSTSVSGGQRQRIALARAILRTPEVLLLDEATAQVDGITEAAIADCIHRRSRRGAVITIAHRLSTVIDADHIIVMEDGRVRADGDHESLLARDQLYRELVEALRIGDRAEAASV